MARTKIDWSKHHITVKKDMYTTIHTITTGSVIYQVNFINTCGNLIVNGDFGNWIFCREFLPSPEGYVSDGYWLEKLSIGSTQEYEKYDAEETTLLLEEELQELNELKRVENTKDYDELIEYYEGCLNCCEEEINYLAFAHDYPSDCDFECVKVGKKTNHWLLIIFDAFEEICRRLKSE